MPDYPDNTKQEADAIVKYLLPIEGGTITQVGVAIEDFNEGIDDATAWWEVIPILIITAKDGTTYQAAVLQDPEGNGPGWLDINKEN